MRLGVNSRDLTPVLVLAALFVVAAGACRHEEAPAARLVVPVSSLRMAYPESVAMALEWTPLAPLAEKMHPTVFAHLIDRPNHVVRTFDHELPGPWTVGVARRDEFDLYQSALGGPLPPGRYTLTVGLYDPALGYRWRLATDGPDVTGHREYRAAEVEAPPGRSLDSRFEFAGGWSAVEPGSDRQVLQRRWLSGAGALRIEPSNAARAVRVELRVMEARARILATCAASADELGPGARWIEVVPAAGEPCEIRLEPAGATPPRWLAVEVLAVRSRPR